MVTQLLIMLVILFVLGYLAIQFLSGLNHIEVEEDDGDDEYSELAETEEGVRTLLKDARRKRKARDKNGALEFLSKSDDPKILKFLLVINEDEQFNKNIGPVFISNLLSKRGEELIDPLFDMLLNSATMDFSSIRQLARFEKKVLPRLLENLDRNPDRVIQTILNMAEEISAPILHSLSNHPKERIRKLIPVRYIFLTSSIEDLIVAYNEEESDKKLIDSLSELIGSKFDKLGVLYFDFFLKTLKSPNVIKRVATLELLRKDLMWFDRPISHEAYISLLKIMQNGTVKVLIEDKSTRIATWNFLHSFFYHSKETAERRQEVANTIAVDNRIVDDLINGSDQDDFWGAVLLVTMYKSDTISIANKKKIFDALTTYMIKHENSCKSLSDSDLRKKVENSYILPVARFLSELYKLDLISKDDKKKIFDLGSIIVDWGDDEEVDDEYRDEDGEWRKTGRTYLREGFQVYFKKLLN